MDVPISEIHIDFGKRRKADPGKVDFLMRDISERGLLAPIVLYRIKGKKDLCLACGLHRLFACHCLKWKTIPAFIREVEDEEEGKDLQDAENLARNELNAIERCLAHARSKRRFLLKHPEARRGGDRRSSKRNNGALIGSYSTNASKDSDRRKRTIEKEVRLGEILEPYADKILGSPIEDSVKNLEELAMFSRDKVLEVLGLISSGKARSVEDAKDAILAKQAPEPMNASVTPRSDTPPESPIETPVFASPIKSIPNRKALVGLSLPQNGNEAPLSKDQEALPDPMEKWFGHVNKIVEGLEPKVAATVPPKKDPPAQELEDAEPDPEERDLLPEIDTENGMMMGYDARGSQIRYNLGKEIHTITDTGEVVPLAKAIGKVLTADPYRILLFETWKAKHGYQKDFGTFLIECFDEFMALRHVELAYTEVIRKNKRAYPSILIAEEN